MAPQIHQVAPKGSQKVSWLLLSGPVTDQRPRGVSNATKPPFECLLYMLGLFRLQLYWFREHFWYLFVVAFRLKVKREIQCTILPENSQRTSQEQVITNGHLENLRDILQIPKRRPHNKLQTTKLGGGGVRAAWRIWISINIFESPARLH